MKTPGELQEDITQLRAALGTATEAYKDLCMDFAEKNHRLKRERARKYLELKVKKKAEKPTVNDLEYMTFLEIEDIDYDRDIAEALKESQLQAIKSICTQVEATRSQLSAIVREIRETEY